METKENLSSMLDKYGLDRAETVKMLREVEYEYIQYNLSESIEEQAQVHPKLPDKIFYIHSLIKVIEE